MSSFSYTRKKPRRAGPDPAASSISADAGPMIAIDVLAVVRCLSCWSVSASAFRPWLTSSGREAGR
jgi:hypothetical protein